MAQPFSTNELLLRSDRIAFGKVPPEVPERTEQTLILPNPTGQYLYFGLSSLVSTSGLTGTLEAIYPQFAAFTFDNLNNRFGINTSTPQYAIDISTTTGVRIQGGTLIANASGLVSVPTAALFSTLPTGVFAPGTIPPTAIASTGQIIPGLSVPTSALFSTLPTALFAPSSIPLVALQSSGIIVASSFVGDGFFLSNIPLANINGTITGDFFRPNSIPLSTLASTGQIWIREPTGSIFAPILSTGQSFTSSFRANDISTINLRASKFYASSIQAIDFESSEFSASNLSAIRVVASSIEVLQMVSTARFFGDGRSITNLTPAFLNNVIPADKFGYRLIAFDALNPYGNFLVEAGTATFKQSVPVNVLGTIYASTFQGGYFRGDGGGLYNINSISTASLVSTVEGLGTVGYVSSTQLASSVRGLATAGYVSSTQLTSTVAGLATHGFISTTQLTSTVAGLGSSEYISSSQLLSTVAGLALFISTFYDDNELRSTVAGLGTSGYISSLSLTSSLVGLGSMTYVSSASLQSTTQFFRTAGFLSSPNLLSTVEGLGSISYVSTTQLISTVEGLGHSGYVSSTQLASTVEGLASSRYVSSTQLASTVEGLATSLYISSTQLISTIEGLGTFLYVSSASLQSTTQFFRTAGFLSSPNLLSTVEGLGSIFYVSSTQLASTVEGLGTSFYVSTASLVSTTQGLQEYVSSFIDPTELTSTVVGLGTAGFVSTIGLDTKLASTVQGLGSSRYVSTASLVSTTQGLQEYVSSFIDPTELTSTVVGLGTAGFVSTIGLDAKLASTVQGLGSSDYVSTLSLVSTTQGLQEYVSSFIDPTELASTVVGLGTAGFVSTIGLDAKLASTVQGLGSSDYVSTASLVSTTQGIQEYVSSFIDPTELASTVVGLGTAGFVSTIGLDAKLASTVQGLGSSDYVSTLSLYSTINESISTFSTAFGPGGVAPFNLASTVEGLGTAGYVSTPSMASSIQEAISSLSTAYGFVGRLTTIPSSLSTFAFFTSSIQASTVQTDVVSSLAIWVCTINGLPPGSGGLATLPSTVSTFALLTSSFVASTITTPQFQTDTTALSLRYPFRDPSTTILYAASTGYIGIGTSTSSNLLEVKDWTPSSFTGSLLSLQVGQGGVTTYNPVSSNYFYYTGTQQSYTIPAGTARLVMRAYGAGGESQMAGGNVGGGGAFVEATLDVNALYSVNLQFSNLYIVVGVGGIGGSGVPSADFWTGNPGLGANGGWSAGGGFTGVFLSNIGAGIVNTCNNTPILIAGAGGAGGQNSGGNGGAATWSGTAWSGNNIARSTAIQLGSNGGGGGQTQGGATVATYAGGVNGSYLRAGCNLPGGGGGYYGGGGGSNTGGGGGGGSSFISLSNYIVGSTGDDAVGRSPGGLTGNSGTARSNSAYPNAGYGGIAGASVGGSNGLVQIIAYSATTVSKPTRAMEIRNATGTLLTSFGPDGQLAINKVAADTGVYLDVVGPAQFSQLVTVSSLTGISVAGSNGAFTNLSTGLITNNITRIGTLSSQTAIVFPGVKSTYSGTVLAEVSTGAGLQELLLYKVSSTSDRVRVQTTGTFVVETGVSARSWPTTTSNVTPAFIINANSNVGIQTASPGATLDVAGTTRAISLSSLQLNVSSINGFLPGAAGLVTLPSTVSTFAFITSSLTASTIQTDYFSSLAIWVCTINGLPPGTGTGGLATLPSTVSTFALLTSSFVASTITTPQFQTDTTSLSLRYPFRDPSTTVLFAASTGFIGLGLSTPRSLLDIRDWTAQSYTGGILTVQAGDSGILPFNTTQYYYYSGTQVTYTVPANVFRVQVHLWGAGGGYGFNGGSGSIGGGGAYVTGLLDVNPGEQYYIRVGGGGGRPFGGYGGGGNGNLGGGGGGGGGATWFIRATGSNILAMAGGGGGGGAFATTNYGGAASWTGVGFRGGPTPQTQTTTPTTNHGGGGDTNAASPAANGATAPTWPGSNGTAGQGGAANQSSGGPGGGGGGWVGGGGGGLDTLHGGGGGGSSYTGGFYTVTGENAVGGTSGGSNAIRIASAYPSAGTATSANGSNGLVAIQEFGTGTPKNEKLLHLLSPGGSTLSYFAGSGALGLGTSSITSGYLLDVSGAALSRMMAIGVLSTGLVLNPLRLGTLSNQTSINFAGVASNYTGTVVAEQAIGVGVQELLLYKVSSATDRVRIQTTGYFSIETGVSARSWPTTTSNVTPAFTVTTASNVGIQIAAPTVPLDVGGMARALSLSTLQLQLSSLVGGTATLSTVLIGGTLSTSFLTGTARQVDVFTNGVSRITVLSNGFVGIGTSSPAFLLDVAGTGEFSTILTSSLTSWLTISTTQLGTSSVVANTTQSIVASSFQMGASTFTGKWNDAQYYVLQTI